MKNVRRFGIANAVASAARTFLGGFSRTASPMLQSLERRQMLAGDAYAEFSGSATTTQGSSYPISIEVSGDDYALYTHFQLNWGDGQTQSITPTTHDDTGYSYVYYFSHTYLTPSAPHITAEITDGSGGYTAPEKHIVTVTNVTPSISTTPASSDTIRGTNPEYSLQFNDPGTLDSHTYSVAWGDGYSTTGVAIPTGDRSFVLPRHNYATIGTYTVSVTVADDRGGISSAKTFSVNAKEAVAWNFKQYPSGVVDPQRLIMKFGQDVSSGLEYYDFHLHNITLESVLSIVPDALQYDSGTNTAVLQVDKLVSAGHLADGNYVLNLAKNLVTDSNDQPLMTDDRFIDFFFYNGDFNHDRKVNFDDQLILSQNYSSSSTTPAKSFAQGDTNADGLVNYDDLLLLGQRFGTDLPAPPSGPNALICYATGYDTIRLKWNASTFASVDGYNIYRSGNGTDFTLLTHVTGAGTLTYDDAGLLHDGTRYWYKIAPTSGSTVYAESNKARDYTALRGADGLQAKDISADALTLAWNDNSKNEDGYRIYRVTSGPGGTVLRELIAETSDFAQTGVASFRLENLVEGQSSSYSVEAFNSLVDAAPTLALSATPVTREVRATLSTAVAEFGDTVTITLVSDGVSGIAHWDIDWGDGTINTHFASAGNTVTHQYTLGDSDPEVRRLFGVAVTATTTAGVVYEAPLLTMSVSNNSQSSVVSPDVKRQILSEFESVFNTIKFEPYFGYKKSLAAVTSTKAANDWDQAALLVDRVNDLENGATATLQLGVIVVKAADLIRWLGVRDQASAISLLDVSRLLAVKDSNNVYQYATSAEALATTGINYNTSEIVRIWHAWVKVSVPGESEEWNLDPSWKYKLLPQWGASSRDAALSGAGYNSQFNTDAYLTARAEQIKTNGSTVNDPRVSDLPLDYYETQLREYIRTGQSDVLRGSTSLSQLVYDGPIIAKRFNDYRNSDGDQYYIVPDGLVTPQAMAARNWHHRIQITFKQTGENGWDNSASPVFDSYTIESPDDLEKSIGIRYSTSGGQSWATLFIGDSPAKINGINVSGEVVEDHVQLTVKVFIPGDLILSPVTELFTKSFRREARQPIAIALGTGAGTETSVAKFQEQINEEISKPTIDWARYQAYLLSMTGTKYWLAKDTQQSRIADLTGAISLLPWIQVGIVSSAPVDSNKYMYDSRLMNPRIYEGLHVDVPGAIAEPSLISGNALEDTGLSTQDKDRKVAARSLMHYNASALESAIIEEVSSAEGVSTVKGLIWAKALNRSIKQLSDFSNQSDPVASFVNWVNTSAFSAWYSAADYALSNTNSSSQEYAHALQVKNLIIRARQQIVNDLNGNSNGPDSLGSGPKHVVVPDVVIDVSDGEAGWTGVTWIRKDPDNPRTEGFVILNAGDVFAHGGGASLYNPLPIFDPAQWSVVLGPSKGDPVNISTGSLEHTEPDVSIALPGMSLKFGRYYESSRALRNLDFGMGDGWLHTYSERMVASGSVGSRTVLWTTPSGGEHEFTETSNGVFSSPAGVFGTLAVAGSGDNQKYTYAETDGSVRVFGYKGRIEEIRDRNNNKLIIRYAAQLNTKNAFKIRTVTAIDASNPTDQSRFLKFTTDEKARITSVDDYTGRNWTYAYGTNANSDVVLSSTTMPDGRGRTFQKQAYKYLYHSDGPGKGLLQRAERWINAGKKEVSGRGARGSTSFEYYPNGRVFSTQDAEGHVEYFRYNLFTAFASPKVPVGADYVSGTYYSLITEDSRQPRTRSAIYVDYNGNASQTLFNDSGMAIRQVTSTRDRIDTAYIAVGSSNAVMTSTIVNEVGLTEAFRYDNKGNVTTHVVNSSQYDANATWPVGLVTKYQYNGFAQVTQSQVENSTRITSYTYDTSGNVLSVTDAEGNVTTYGAYEANGLPGWMKLPAGATPVGGDGATYYYYSDSTLNGVPVRIVETKRKSLVGGSFQSTFETYDWRGHLVRTKDASNHVVDFVYDEMGRMKSRSEVVGGATLLTTFGYDDGLQTSAKDARGTYSFATYDLNRRQTGTQVDQSISSVEFDGQGNLIAATDPNGRKTETLYDANGRIVEVLGADGTYTMSLLDGVGRSVVTISSTGSFAGYGLERQAMVMNVYDSKGLLVSTTAPTGYRTDFSHNDFGQVVMEKQFDSALGSSPYLTVKYSFDSLGRVIGRRGDDKIVEKTTFDGRGNVTESTRYDVTATPLATILSDSFQFSSISQANRRTTTTVYDLMDQPVAVSDPSGAWTRSYFDVNGSVRYVVDARNAVAPTFSSGVLSNPDPTNGTPSNLKYTVEYQYDEAGRKIKEILPGANADTPTVGRDTTDLEYDQNGNLRFKTVTRDVVGTTPVRNAEEFRYDSQNRLQYHYSPRTNSSGGRYYERHYYNSGGELIRTRDANGVETRFTYDSAGRKTQIVLPNKDDPAQQGPRLETKYDLAGNVKWTKSAEGGATLINYDNAGRVTGERTAIRVSSDIDKGTTTLSGTTYDTFTVRFDNVRVQVGDRVGLAILDDGDQYRMNMQVIAATDESITLADNGSSSWSTSVLGAVLFDGFDKRLEPAASDDKLYIVLPGVETTYLSALTTQTQDAVGTKVKTTVSLGSNDTGRTVFVESTPNGPIAEEGTLSFVPRSLTVFDALGQTQKVIERHVYYMPIPSNLLTLTRARVETNFEYDLNSRLKREIADNADGTSADAEEDLRSSVTTYNAITEYGYDAVGNLIYTVSPRGNTGVTGLGTVAQRVASNLYTETRIYDARSRLTSITAADPDATSLSALGTKPAPTQSFAYFADGLTRWEQDANGSKIEYAYYADGLVQSETRHVYLSSSSPDVTATSTYEYDGNGNRTKATDKNGYVREFLFDRQNREYKETWPVQSGTERFIERSFDADGNVTSINNQLFIGATENLGDASYTYDSLGAVTSASDSGTTVGAESTYTLRGERRSVVFNRGTTQDSRNQYWYTANGQLKAVAQDRPADPSGFQTKLKTISYVNEDGDRQSSVAHSAFTPSSNGSAPAGSSAVPGTTYYEWRNRLGEVVWTRRFMASGLIDEQIVRDEFGGRINRTYGIGSDRTHTYDSVDQMTADTWSSKIQSFDYDTNGNRRRKVSGSPVGTVEIDNRIKQDDQFTYTYDKEGNILSKLRSDGTGFTYFWDRRNRLIEAKEFGTASATIAVQVSNYEYDSMDRRVRKAVYRTDPATGNTVGTPITDERYAYDGSDLILVLDGSNNVLSRYFYEPESETPVAEDVAASGQTQWFLTDRQGSVRRVVDNSGTILQRFDYDAYGNISVAANTAESGMFVSNDGASPPRLRDDRWTVIRESDIGQSDGQGGNIQPKRAYSLGDGVLGYTTNGDSPSGEDGNVPATYTFDFTTTINLSDQVDLSGFTLTGTAYVDNYVSAILVNGVSNTVNIPWQGASNPSTFKLTNGFQAGVNTITFKVVDREEPGTGLGVTMTLKVLWDTALPRFLYTGQQYDAETGLQYYGARYYQSDAGRFLNQDPARDGENWYAYVHGSPANLVDPTGLAAVTAGSGDSDIGVLSDRTMRSAVSTWDQLDGQTRRNFSNDSNLYAAHQVSAVLGGAGYRDRADEVLTRAYEGSSVAATIRQQNAASQAAYVNATSGWRGTLSAVNQVAGGAAEGYGGAWLNNANTFTFGGFDAAGDWLSGSDDWRVWRDGRDYAGGKVAGTVAREALITAGTLGISQVARGGIAGTTWSANLVNAAASSPKVYNSSRGIAYGLAAYDSASGGYHIGNGIMRVSEGDKWGYVEAAGGGLSFLGSAASFRELGERQLGGAYQDIKALTGEVHHTPAKSAIFPTPKAIGPSIWMEAPDHAATASYALLPGSKKYIAAQKGLVAKGKFGDAVNMDVLNVRTLFPGKYDQGIQEMLNYVNRVNKGGHR